MHHIYHYFQCVVKAQIHLCITIQACGFPNGNKYMQNFANSCLKNDPFFLISRIRAFHWKHTSFSLRWRHNDHDSVSNHKPHGCLLSRLFGRRSKKHQSSASLAFVRRIHRDRWIPRTKGQLRGKCFHLMTSSCLREMGRSMVYALVGSRGGRTAWATSPPVTEPTAAFPPELTKCGNKKNGLMKYKSAHFTVTICDWKAKQKSKIWINVHECHISFKRLSSKLFDSTIIGESLYFAAERI